MHDSVNLSRKFDEVWYWDREGKNDVILGSSELEVCRYGVAGFLFRDKQVP